MKPKRNCFRCLCRTAAHLSFIVFACPLPALRAASIYWAVPTPGSPVTGPYSTAELWEEGVVPGAEDSARVEEGTVQIDGDWSVQELIAGAFYGAEGSFVQTDGTVTIGDQLLLGWEAVEGSNAIGNYTLQGGSLIVTNRIHIGEAGTGVLTIEGGTLEQLNGGSVRIIVGNRALPGNEGVDPPLAAEQESVYASPSSRGTVHHSAGTFTSTSELFVGHGSGGSGEQDEDGGYSNDVFGTYNLSGTGLLHMKNWTVIGRTGGEGVLNLTGGTLTKTDNGSFLVGSHDGARTNTHGTVHHSAGVLSITSGVLEIGGGRNVGLGIRGNGVYNLSGGGQLETTTRISIGISGGIGEFNMTGGSITKTGGNFIVGDTNDSEGTLNHSAGTITNGGETFIGQGSDLGAGTYGRGIYNLSGDAVLNMTNWLAVGRQGATGVIHMTGGTITKTGNGNIVVGTNTGGHGTVNQSAGTVENSAAATWLGENNNATGIWNLSGTGIANFNLLRLGQNGESNGTFHLDGGTLTVGKIDTTSSGTSLFHFNGGTLRASAGDDEESNFLASGITTAVHAGGALIDTNGFDITFDALLESGVEEGEDGGLTKTGAGTLRFDDLNSYTGPTEIQEGTLELLLFAGIDNDNAVTIAEAAALVAQEATSIGGSVSLAGSLGFSGSTPGALDIGQTLTLEPTATATFRLGASAGLADQVSVTGALAIDGALALSYLGSASYQEGDMFTIASASSLTGRFANAADGAEFSAGGNTFRVDYSAQAVTLTVLESSAPADGYDAWAAANNLDASNNGPLEDPDGDGLPNFLEFALDGGPLQAGVQGKVATRVVELPEGPALTLTLPVRNNVSFSGSGNLVSEATDGIVYTIQGSTDLEDFTSMSITELTPALSEGMPDLSGTGWSYRTFRAAGTPGAPDTREFLRVTVELLSPPAS